MVQWWNSPPSAQRRKGRGVRIPSVAQSFAALRFEIFGSVGGKHFETKHSRKQMQKHKTRPARSSKLANWRVLTVWRVVPVSGVFAVRLSSCAVQRSILRCRYTLSCVRASLGGIGGKECQWKCRRGVGVQTYRWVNYPACSAFKEDILGLKMYSNLPSWRGLVRG